MKRFGFVFDPLFLICCGLYAANRWWIKPHFHSAFFHDWFNDLLLIPCALPLLLLIQYWLGLREHDGAPTFWEVASHVIGWSILFEVIGPHILPTTGDPLDAAAYAVGGVVAWVVWRLIYQGRAAEAANFNWLAPHYRWMEWVLAGTKLQRCRGAFLTEIAAPRRALIVGQGHGPFVADLLKAHPNVQCACIDVSAKMLEAAKARLRSEGVEENRVEFIHADILEWEPPHDYDLIATHFVLDCFRPDQLERILAKLSRASSPSASWLVADFQEPESGLARWRALAILEMMYLFFRWATGLPAANLTPPDPFLERHGFSLSQRQTFEWGLLHSDHWIRPGAMTLSGSA
ncbi:MAG TPA: class I SAM-dependent methyltransferase [Verrucomicrobiae bacterium]